MTTKTTAKFLRRHIGCTFQTLRRNEELVAKANSTTERISTDGSTVRLSWFEDGATAIVHIIRKKSGVTFNMSRAEAEALRAFCLPINQTQICKGNAAMTTVFVTDRGGPYRVRSEGLVEGA
jgi:hypothetical protein